MRKIFSYALASALVLVPLTAKADSVSRGAAAGAHAGDKALGVPGAIVGGAVGGVVGGVAALLGADQSPRFREYVVAERHPSYRWDERVVVGATLPAAGVEYYVVPDEYGVRGYRYTVVNDRIVLVDPHTHRIVQIIG
ncbi:MAG: DUF1236 domain-containing protein [Rhodoblastus sp.]|nr:DUF1236 domain-containing protein [Rhodoblastus sp.]